MHNYGEAVSIGTDFQSTDFANGKIDEVAIIPSELSAAQVAAIYNSGVPADLTSYSPVLWTRFEEGTGTSIADSSGNGHTATLTNGPTFSSDVPVYVFNRYSTSYDGTDDYADCGDVTTLNSASAFTFSVWVKFPNTTDVAHCMSKYLNATNRMHIAIASNILYFNLSNGGSQYGQVAFTNTDWCHIAMVYDGSLSGNSNRLKAYINNVQQSLTFTGTIQATTVNLTGQPLRFWNQGSTYGAALCDEYALFNSALTTGQLTTIYNGGTPTDLTSLNPVGWWRMGDNDGGTGTTITDQGSGGNDATLTNGPTFSTDVPT